MLSKQINVSMKPSAKVPPANCRPSCFAPAFEDADPVEQAKRNSLVDYLMDRAPAQDAALAYLLGGTFDSEDGGTSDNEPPIKWGCRNEGIIRNIVSNLGYDLAEATVKKCERKIRAKSHGPHPVTNNGGYLLGFLQSAEKDLLYYSNNERNK